MFRSKLILYSIAVTCLYSCSFQKIETGSTLDTKTLGLIKSLGLLDNDEQIIKYYSNFEKDKAGSFFTNKRMAHYWLDKSDQKKNDTTFAFYSDVISIDTVYDVPDTFAPYLEVTLKDSTSFKLYAGGNKNETKSFFEDAIKNWRRVISE